MEWIKLAQDRGQWRAVFQTVMKIRLPLKTETGQFLKNGLT